MHILDRVEEFADKHIESIIEKENVTPDCIEMLGELVDIVKDVSEYRKNDSTTYAMDNYGSEKTMEYTRRYSDSMPYYRDRMDMNYGNNYGRRMPYNNMYGDKEDLLHQMEMHLKEAQSEHERQAIQDCMNKLKAMN